MVRPRGRCYTPLMKGLLQARLDALAEAKLLRTDSPRRRQLAEDAARQLDLPLVDAASNDYLGLARDPMNADGAIWGAGASRLIHGTHEAHLAAERALASWLGAETALLFSSGYAANVGAIQALAGPEDLIASDELNHASIIDGCRLSPARVVTYAHADPQAAARALARPCSGSKWLVTESLFSMDGDVPDLRALRSVADEAGAAMYVDEAHALGVYGDRGAGLCRQFGVDADVRIATFGKALGAQGACAVGPAELRSWLWNRARSFVYSTATSPALAALLQERVRRVSGADNERRQLRAVVGNYIDSLQGVLQINTGSWSPIVPIRLKTTERATRAANVFLDRGILVQAIRPPTVPEGEARIRLTLKSSFSEQTIARLVEATRLACAE